MTLKDLQARRRELKEMISTAKTESEKNDLRRERDRVQDQIDEIYSGFYTGISKARRGAK